MGKVFINTLKSFFHEKVVVNTPNDFAKEVNMEAFLKKMSERNVCLRMVTWPIMQRSMVTASQRKETRLH